AVDGTYMMFSHDIDADQAEYARFKAFTDAARKAGLSVGKLHGAPTFEILTFPKARFDLVRPGNVLFGNVPNRKEVTQRPDVKVVYRLCARVARLERLREGEGASFASGK